MFHWPNLLLCCSECGRLKGVVFPLDGEGAPLLIDPTAEDPWEYLTFDPDTGNLTARFSEDYSPKGIATVATLQLDRREALARVYQRTFRRLKALVQGCLDQPLTVPELPDQLDVADDHGLLGWCFGSGQDEAPFGELKARHPEVWAACLARFGPRPGAQ